MKRVEPNRNVYVGHRYVPLLVGEWDKSIQYEGLSIVTFKGNSYTSKKMTPPGIDIENEEYWVMTGNYNAQIEYYRMETERVSEALETKIDREELNDFKVEINSDVDRFKTTVNDDIGNFKTTVNDDIGNFKTNVNDNISNFKDDINTSLDDTNDRMAFISINDFPRLDNEVEDSARINRAIESVDEGVIQLYNGIYETKNPIRLKSNITLNGENQWKTEIRNTGGTNVIETVDTDVRHYNMQVNEMTIDGDEIGTQTGLNLPHVTYFNSRNVTVTNCETGIYQIARNNNDEVTGAYYNHYFNPHVTRCTNGIIFHSIANENVVYGGKITLCDNGTIIYANSIKYFGTAFEGNHQYHVKFYGFNNSLFGVRMEGFNTCTGILNNPSQELYPNYAYSTHYQGLKWQKDDVTGTLFNLDEQGVNIPLRGHRTGLNIDRESIGSDLPLVKMTSTGTAPVYQSVSNTGRHFEALNKDGERIASITQYGEFSNNVPGRGIRLTSPDGTNHILRVTDSGELEIVSI